MDEAFLLKFGLISSPRAVYHALRESKEVSELRSALRQGQLTDLSIRRFVSDILKTFRVGELFPYDLSLAAIAVAMERRRSAFAEEFLSDLTRLSLNELPMAIHVARHASRARLRMTRNKSAFCSLMRGSDWPERWEKVARSVERRAGRLEFSAKYGAA